MQIQLQKIIPAFFDPSMVTTSQVWLQQVVIKKGEQVHIVAPSGSGKTSLIHFLYGLRKDYNGTILFDSTNIAAYDAEKTATWRQQHVSIVFQDLRLFTNHTVLQNLEIKRNLHPFHDKSKIAEMAARLGIGNKLNRLCATCSYGEQQRIAIIRALQQPFDFLLLDEPFSHLDEHNRHRSMELIAEEAALRKATVILADLKQIEYFTADRILHMA